VILVMIDAILSLLPIWSISSNTASTRAAFIRVVDAESSSHYFVVIEVANCRCCLIDVCEFSEPKSLGLAGFLVVDEAEIKDGASLTKGVDDLFFRQTYRRVRM
jgi:hypothetical protein